MFHIYVDVSFKQTIVYLYFLFFTCLYVRCWIFESGIGGDIHYPIPPLCPGSGVVRTGLLCFFTDKVTKPVFCTMYDCLS